MLNLYFKQAFAFIHVVDGAQKIYNAVPGNSGPVPVPEWVKETLTYQYGLKAKTIIDLTPPSKKAKREMEVELQEANPGLTEEQIADAAKAAQPQAPLGIQGDSVVDGVFVSTAKGSRPKGK